MRGKLWFLGGLAAGYVLGTRAGREKYEELASTARKIKEHPTVQEARGVVQEQASRLLSESKDKLSQSRFADTKLGERLLSSTESGTSGSTTKSLGTDSALDDSSLAMSGTSSSTTRSTGTGSSSGTSRSSSGTSSTNSSSTNY